MLAELTQTTSFAQSVHTATTTYVHSYVAMASWPQLSMYTRQQAQQLFAKEYSIRDILSELKREGINP